VEEEEAMGEVEEPTMTEIATTAATDIGLETKMGMLTTKDLSAPAQLC